ncbi:MAG TPA: preprotein translocase subunit SecG [Pirellulales bacterium]|jgi:preprotein translocase subunit SecG
MNAFLGILLIVTSLFLILIVLLQRGRGGGLAGAFGGMGGQSAFGTKAGDLFTKITVVTAIVWILLCIVGIKVMGGHSSPLSSNLGGNSPDALLPPSKGGAAPGDKAAPGGDAKGTDAKGTDSSSAGDSGAKGAGATEAAPAKSNDSTPAATPSSSDQSAPAKEPASDTSK